MVLNNRSSYMGSVSGLALLQLVDHFKEALLPKAISLPQKRKVSFICNTFPLPLGSSCGDFVCGGGLRGGLVRHR